MALTIDSTALLNNSVKMPLLGLGVFRIPAGGTTTDVCSRALSVGYRHLDTAKIYRNERAVGEAVRAAGCPRSDIFVTTKLWNTDHGYHEALAAGHESLRTLGLDYIDLYLVHWPVEDKRLDTWKAMEKLLSDSVVRAIGVSNYMVRHLDELLEHCTVPPAVNQIELHPYNYEYRRDVVDLCDRNGILIEAYSPLTSGRKLDDPRLAQLAEPHGKTPAQVLIRWALEHGFAVIPKSSRTEGIEQNADVFDFSLSEADMSWLDDFNEDFITSWDPTDAP